MIEIPIASTKFGNFVAMIDDEDYELVSQCRKWGVAGKRHKGRDWLYAFGSIKGKDVYMHRLVMGAVKGQIVDHVNGNRLDNRKENLRICTQGENTRCRNKHRTGNKYKGVYPNGNKKKETYSVSIFHAGQAHRIGTFDDEIEAALAYDRAAIKLHGEFAKTNFGVSVHE